MNCKYCDALLPVGSNPRRLFCSDAHKMKWHRQQQQDDQHEALLNELADLRAKVRDQAQEIVALEQQVQALKLLASTTVAATPGQQPKRREQIQQDAAAPEGFTWLNDFADLHGMSRNEAQERWQHGMISGQKINTGKRRAPVAIAEKGKHDFWTQFHDLEGFRSCDNCPHS